MSEISELISLLDERGVEWSNAPTWILRWRDSERREAKAVGFSNGLLCSAYLTPEQAVEATLGRGTCRMTEQDDGFGWWECSECGGILPAPDIINYCPNCGRKVVDA